MNLATVDDSASVGYNFVLKAMVPPAKCMQIPVKDWQVLTHVAQTESQ
jgi:hypothetical protein